MKQMAADAPSAPPAMWLLEKRDRRRDDGAIWLQQSLDPKILPFARDEREPFE